jgi:predicted deacetylase
MSHARWHRFLPLIRAFGIKPLLSVVPDNQSPELMLSNADPDFWTHMQQLQAAGATIAMQGFHNVRATRGKCLIGAERETEFAGIDEWQQREWIRTGLEILRGNGLKPRLFVAPHRGFDDATLRALCAEGLLFLSDGFGKVPYSRGGITWIPQQLSMPERRSSGLWTIGIHTNAAPNSTLGSLGEFLRRYAGQFTFFDRVLAEYVPAEFGRAERWRETAAVLRMRMMGGGDR